MSGQYPDRVLLLLRPLPGQFQGIADRFYILGPPRPLRRLAPLPLGKLGALFRLAHVHLAPGPDRAPIDQKPLRRREELPDQFVGPAPPLQQGGGPIFSTIASRHSTFSSLTVVRFAVSIAEMGEIFNATGTIQDPARYKRHAGSFPAANEPAFFSFFCWIAILARDVGRPSGAALYLCRLPQSDILSGVGVQLQAGPAAALPLVVPLAPDHGGVVLPRKLRFPGTPSFFNARDGKAVPPPRFSLGENACTALPRRPICDGAPATTPLIPGRYPGWRRRSAPGRPCGRPSTRSTPGTRSWRRCPPQKAPLSGDPVFFQCSGRQSRPSAKVFAG